MLLVGVHQNSTKEQSEVLAVKCAELRIFADDAGKMNLSAKDLGLGALVISQFTLYGDTRKGRRPSYLGAAAPEEANRLYEVFLEEAGKYVSKVGTGRFQAMMDVELVNNGPVTIILDSSQAK